MVKVRMSNINNAQRHPKIEFDISGTAHLDQDLGERRTVYIHIRDGMLSGGFHTTVESAEELVKTLQEQIRIAKAPIEKVG